MSFKPLFRLGLRASQSNQSLIGTAAALPFRATNRAILPVPWRDPQLDLTQKKSQALRSLRGMGLGRQVKAKGFHD